MARLIIASLLLLSLIAIASATEYRYVSKPTMEKPEPKPHGLDNVFNKIFGVEGKVYCKHGSKSLPLQGAIVRITCVAEGREGYETAPFSILSRATNENGYFFASLCPIELAKKKLKDCKVYLKSSPMETCNVPTDENKGVSGCPLTTFRFLENKMKLYTLKSPLYYKPKYESTSPIPKGY